MAIENAKTLNVRIRNKYDSYENWAASSLVLEAGEIAIAYTTVDVKVDNGMAKHPALLMKVGDGSKTFANLPWLSARAADVLSVCKNEADLTAFVNGVIANAGIASSEAMSTLAGRVTTAEGEIDALQADLDTAETGLKARVTTAEAAIDALELLVGNTKVADQISAAIAALNLGDTYAAKVHGHEIADVNGLSDAIAAAKKAGTDANSALETYKTLNDAAVKVNSDAITAIKNGETIDNFKEVEEALAGKQAAGDYAINGHKHEIADVNGLSNAIADAKKAGEDAAAALEAYQGTNDAAVAKKVDKVEGKSLILDTEITRLAGMSDGANKVEASENNGKIKIDGVETTVYTHPAKHNITDIEGLQEALDGKQGSGDFAAENHKHVKADITDFEHTHVASEITDLDATIKAYDYATKGEAQGYVDTYKTANDKALADEVKAREDADTALQEAIDAINNSDTGLLKQAKDYTDGKDTAMNTRVEALEAKFGDGEGNVEAQIAAAVKEEADRAKGVEGGLETRLATVEGDYLKGADKTELEGKIQSNADAIALLTNGVDSETVDGVNDLIAYVAEHGTEVTGMKADIKQNADDVDALEGRMDTAEGAIALKASQADLEALDGRVETVEGELNTATTGLKARMTAAEADIDALEGKVDTGDQKVSEYVAAAIEALKIGDYAKASALTEEINRAKAAEEANAAAAAAAQAAAEAAQSAADKAQGEVDALELEVAKKANDADLAAIAKTGSTDDLVQGEMVLVFDCGTSAV